MSLHYGPKWCWDQNRPEAIGRVLEMAKFHKKLQRTSAAGRQDIQEDAGLSCTFHQPDIFC